MATLTNPIEDQNIVDRYADYVRAAANTGIVWGTNSNPTHSDGTVVLDDSYFGGDTGGRGIGIGGGNLGGTGAVITASTIYNTLLTETYNYSRIRSVQARLNVTGGGGNTGSRPSPGIIYDQTNIAHMSDSYRVDLGSPSNNGVSSTSLITDEGLEGFFSTLRNSYNAARGSTVTVTTDVCHASCHSSCHGSRGRR